MPRTSLYAVRVFAQAGQALFLASLLLVTATSGQAALGMSSVLIGMTVGALLFGVAGGALVDRVGPRNGLALGALSRVVVIGSAFAVLERPELAWAPAVAYSMASQLFSPSEMALVPVAAPVHRASRTHSHLLFFQVAGQGAGWLAALALFAVGGPAWMLAGAAACMAAATCLALALRSLARNHPVSRTARAANQSPLAAVRHFIANPGAAYAVVLLAFAELVLKSGGMALPGYLSRDLNVQGPALAAVVAPAVGGALLAILWAARSFRVSYASDVLRLSLLGIMAALAAMAGLARGLWPLNEMLGPYEGVTTMLALEYAVLVPIAALAGASLCLAIVAGRAVLTATARHGEHGRVFASQAVVAEIAIVLPLLAGGAGTELVGSRVTFLFLIAIGALALLTLERGFLRTRDPGTLAAETA